MSLKKLIVRRKRKTLTSPANVIIQTLRRFGVSAPVTTAAAITGSLHDHGYHIVKSPRP